MEGGNVGFMGFMGLWVYGFMGLRGLCNPRPTASESAHFIS